MKRIVLSLLATASLGFFLVQCSKPYDINQQNVERVLQKLSSDSMKGRYTFSPDIKRAADFIAGEFKTAGLSPLDGAGDFHQRFNLYSISPVSSSVIINGKSIPSKNYFITSTSKTINWDTKDVKTVRISAKDDFRARLNALRRDDKSSLVLVDKAHKEMFERFYPFFSRPTRTFNKQQGTDDVFVLYNGSPKSYKVQLENNIEPIELANVVGQIKGKRSDEIVVFSAHYDHLGVVEPVEGDSIANGANDDASGVTAVIELAYYFKSLPQPERTLYFVTFTGEEVGGYGSRYFSEQLDPDQIVAMFNIEMIGKPAVDGPNTAWITGFDKSDFGKILQANTKGTGYTFYPDPYPKQNLFYRSDNATLARLGVPAHSISTTPIDVDPDYHQVSDEIETLNIPHITNTIKAIALGARGIVSGKDTPSRVDPTTIR